ncbi:MAG TPA: SpoIIE family protein phosphatase [Bacteroidales bacterium]|nr:SpoIIE family protein phosphatase [Bacteroidales bacterium]HPO66651.1 SpoIIE family protein phosphatase [Bacteroidales bacterium]
MSNTSLHHAADWKALCRSAVSLKPDIIVIDSALVDFLRGVRIIKRLEEVKNIPLVVLCDRDAPIDEYFAAGVDDFLFRPFSWIDLQCRLQVAFRLGDTLKTIKNQNLLLQKTSEELKKQYNLLDEQRRDIIDDITYSRRIQNAIMPSPEMLACYFQDYFLFYRPKRIVSGDFYWVAAKEGKTIVAVADCTGHGLSGALLTIAGTAFLNEIINYTPLNAAEFLNQLRLRIMRLLHQRGLEGEAADGMDISLAILDYKQKHLQYAGANNPAYLIRTSGELLILPADRMPIGIHDYCETPFTNHTYSFEHGDMLYLFSDGYADQFGGPHDQKFRTKRFQELCKKVYHLPTAEQRAIFERTIDEWMGYRDQVDDISIIGIRC